MATDTKATWVCEVCGHEWLQGNTMPTHCASSRCRSRKWNAGSAAQSERTVELNREEGSDCYEVVYLLDGEVQGVLEYPHQGRWPQMQDDIDGWRYRGTVPDEAAC